MTQDLPSDFIHQCAFQLGATKVPVDEINRHWRKIKDNGSWGCLGSEAGRKLFVAYRLRELGCFEVGCRDLDFHSGCEMHFFDIYDDTKNLTDEEYAEFMNYRKNEATVAATKLSSLIDANPVNKLAERSTYFPRSKSKA
jgi:hypothetical protein